jgi:hypothetical protein
MQGVVVVVVLEHLLLELEAQVAAAQVEQLVVQELLELRVLAVVAAEQPVVVLEVQEVQE